MQNQVTNYYEQKTPGKPLPAHAFVPEADHGRFWFKVKCAAGMAAVCLVGNYGTRLYDGRTAYEMLTENFSDTVAASNPAAARNLRELENFRPDTVQPGLTVTDDYNGTYPRGKSFRQPTQNNQKDKSTRVVPALRRGTCQVINGSKMSIVRAPSPEAIHPGRSVSTVVGTRQGQTNVPPAPRNN